MDLTVAFSNLQAQRVAANVQASVAGKVLRAQRAEGATAIQLIAAATGGESTAGSSGNPSAGDALVAQATGLGGSVDTYA